MTFSSTKELPIAWKIVGELSPYFVVFLLILSQSSVGRELNTYSINYKASAGLATASATRSFLKSTTNSYELLNTIEVSAAAQSIMNITERSKITLSESQQLIPLSYSMRQTGYIDKSVNIEFDWVQPIATISTAEQSQTVKIEDQIFDKLSHQLFIHSNIRETTNKISFNIIDESGIQEYRYIVLGYEDIETPLGQFSSIKIERNLPKSSSRSVIFWLSSEWEGILLKMDQVINGIITVTLEIQEGRVNGKSITGR
tara:strand:- start:8322 stop:9092 length:771 start_codon:yes stop_codon:yes gene_type:complete